MMMMMTMMMMIMMMNLLFFFMFKTRNDIASVVMVRIVTIYRFSTHVTIGFKHISTD